MAKTSKATTKAGTGKIVKAIIVGPTIAILGTTLVYMLFWLITKAFTAVHSLVLAKLIPWISSSWWILLMIWAGIALTSGVYYVYEQKKKQNKAANKAVAKAKKEKSEDESRQELGGYPCAPITPIEMCGYMEQEGQRFERIFGTVNTEEKERKVNKNPDDLISLGKPYNPQEDTNSNS